MSEDHDGLTKVHIDLPNHWQSKGESMWARPLGDDLYEIHNVPFCAYGLNCLDVVLATADAPDLKPEIRKVVRRSGNQTLRVIYEGKTDRDQQNEIIDTIRGMDAWVERSSKTMICININPSADYQAICNYLFTLEQDGWLQYETCEERVAGSFDDLPDAA